jgi:hypothetical protein
MITLLNGEEWQEADILKRMEDDSFYYGHLGQHALSSSALKKVLTSPNAYLKSLRVSDTGQALRDGRLIHMSILEKEKLSDLIVIEGTKAKKEFKDAVEEHGEHMVYTESEMQNAYWIADAVLNNNEASFLLEDCDFELPGVSMIDGLAFRAKADVVSKDRRKIIDIKTTSSDIQDFKYAAKKFSYDLQAALYLRVFNADEFVFLVVNKDTKDIGIFECSEQFLEWGNNAVEHGIKMYKYWLEDPIARAQIKQNYVIRGIL